MVYYDILDLFFSFESIIPGISNIIQTSLEKKPKESISEEESIQILLQILKKLKENENLEIAKTSYLLETIINDNPMFPFSIGDLLKEENYQKILTPTLLIQENHFIGYRGYIYEVSIHLIRLLISVKLNMSLEELEKISVTEEKEIMTDVRIQQLFNHLFSLQDKIDRPILLFRKYSQLEVFYNSFQTIKNIINKKMGNIEEVQAQLLHLQIQLNEQTTNKSSNIYCKGKDDNEIINSIKCEKKSLNEEDLEKRLSFQREELAQEFEGKLLIQKKEFEKKEKELKENLEILINEKEISFLSLLNSERAKFEEKMTEKCNQITMLKREVKRMKIEIEVLKNNLKLEMINNDWYQENYKEQKRINEQLKENKELLEKENEKFSNALSQLKRKNLNYKKEIKKKNSLLEKYKRLLSFYKGKNIRNSFRLRRKLFHIERMINLINTNVTFIRENGFFNIF